MTNSILLPYTTFTGTNYNDMNSYHIPEDYRNEAVSFSSLPSVDELELTALLPKYITQMRLEVSLWMLIPLLIYIVVWVLVEPLRASLWALLIPIGVMLLWWSGAMLWLKRAYAVRGYAFREKDLTFRKGLFFRRTTTMPVSRIQQVTVKQSLFERWLGLYSIKIADGSQGGVALTIPGLTKDKAETMRSYLLRQMAHEGL